MLTRNMITMIAMNNKANVVMNGINNTIIRNHDTTNGMEHNNSNHIKDMFLIMVIRIQVSNWFSESHRGKFLKFPLDKLWKSVKLLSLTTNRR